MDETGLGREEARIVSIERCSAAPAFHHLISAAQDEEVRRAPLTTARHPGNPGLHRHDVRGTRRNPGRRGPRASIQHVDEVARSVVVKQGSHEMTFVLASDAHLLQGKKTLQTSDLAGDIGHHVKVRYTMNAGNKVADRIEVSESLPAKSHTQ